MQTFLHNNQTFCEKDIRLLHLKVKTISRLLIIKEVLSNTKENLKDIKILIPR